jgi:TonB-dependent SusC/RagA subfamily outer membrane receptor
MAPLLNFDWFSVEESVLYGSPVLYGSSNLIRSVLPTTTGYNGIHLDWSDYVLIAACIITLALVGLLIMYIIKIKLLKRKWEVTKMEGFDFINTNEDNAPFSFLNNLFWKQSISLQEEGGQQIFKHEITHIQQKHTWDRIYCQLVASVFWMNPFNWIIQKELIAIHEFIADEEAVGNSNVEAFAKMLLQTHYGNHFLNPTHSFFYSSIKRRLAMLTKSTNIKYSYLRRVMILPVLIVSVCLISIKVHAKERIEKKVEEIKNNFSLLVSDTSMPTKKDNFKSPPIPPKPSDPTTPPKPSLVSPTYYIDGVKVTEQEMKSMTPENIKSINVLKGEQAIKKYPKDGENGIIEISTKFIERKDQLPNKEWSNINAYQESRPGQNKITYLNMANGVKLEVNGSVDTLVSNAIKQTPLYVLDGTPIKSFEGISPTDIESILILKDAASTSVYGDAAKNGVVLITSRKWGINHVVNVQNKMPDVTVIGYGTKNSNDVLVMNSNPVFHRAQKPASFPGGTEGWSKYLMNNLDRDLPYKNKAVPGKYIVKLNFVINKNGEVENVIAENNPGYGTATEAIRVIEKGPKWIPAEQNGNKVNYLMKQVIVFTVANK